MHAIPALREFSIRAVTALRTQDEWIAKMDAIKENQESAEWHRFKARRKYVLVEDYVNAPWT